MVFETHDAAHWRAHLHLLRSGHEFVDWSTLRVDTLCGRLKQPTTYRLSRFVPTATNRTRTNPGA